MKKGLEQVVPLSQQAYGLFATALEHARDDCVFPADLGRVPHDRGRSRTLSINPQSVTRAMARLLEGLAIDDGNTHDFRRTIAAWLSEREIRPDVITKCGQVNSQPGSAFGNADRQSGSEIVRPQTKPDCDTVLLASK